MKRIFLFVLAWQMCLLGAADKNALSAEQMMKYCNEGIQKKKFAMPIKWLARLDLLIHVDWDYLDAAQLDKWRDIFDRSVIAIEEKGIDQQGVKRARIKAMIIEFKAKEWGWVWNKIRTDPCVDWSPLLGAGTIALPSADKLTKHRIEELRALEVVQKKEQAAQLLKIPVGTLIKTCN